MCKAIKFDQGCNTDASDGFNSIVAIRSVDWVFTQPCAFWKEEISRSALNGYRHRLTKDKMTELKFQM